MAGTSKPIKHQHQCCYQNDTNHKIFVNEKLIRPGYTEKLSKPEAMDIYVVQCEELGTVELKFTNSKLTITRSGFLNIKLLNKQTFQVFEGDFTF